MFQRLAISIGSVAILLLAALGACNKHETGETVAPQTGENRPEHDEACDQASIGSNESFTCDFDSQCVICHDGSACGIVVNQEEYDRRGEECLKEDSADCEYSTTRCCNRHCILSPF